MKNDGHSRESKKPSSKALDHPLNYSKEPLFEIYVTFVPKHHFLFRITRILFHFIFLLSRHSTSYTQVRRIIVQFYDGNQRGTTTEMIFFSFISFIRSHQVAAHSFDAIISRRYFKRRHIIEQ